MHNFAESLNRSSTVKVLKVRSKNNKNDTFLFKILRTKVESTVEKCDELTRSFIFEKINSVKDNQSILFCICNKNMAEIYKLIHPVKYFNDYLSRNIRPDGRAFHEQRNIKLNVNSIKASDASAVVKCGNTTVVCGIKLELATPKAEEPDVGFLVTNVELPPLCSSKYRPGPPSDSAQVTSTLVSDIIINSKCIDLKDLSIVHDKLAWVLYCDMVCIDNDGSLVDACIMTLMASLKTLTLPMVTYDPETEEISVDASVRTKLNVHGLPVATSFALYKHDQKNIVLADPSAYEEEMCGGIGANLITCYNKGILCGSQKFGGCNLSIECEVEALKIAIERARVVEEVIEVCIKNYELESNK